MLNSVFATFLCYEGIYNKKLDFYNPTILMIERIDGSLGFIGGKSEKDESDEITLKRELEEEINYKNFNFNDFKHIITHSLPKGHISLYCKVVDKKELENIKKNIFHAKHYRVETLSTIEIPIYINNTEGLINFLRHSFIEDEIVKEEIFHLISKFRLISNKNMQLLSIQTNLTLEKDIEDLVFCLTNSNKTIATMESCTAGLLAQSISRIKGASDVLKGGYITYSTEQKIKNGVNKNIIDKYSVYSFNCTDEMAKMAAIKSNSDIGIGISGVLNNIDKNNPNTSKGKVYYSIYYNNKIIIKDFLDNIPTYDKRIRQQEFVVYQIIRELLIKRTLFL